MSNLDAIIKKLSKKIKMGEYDPVEVVDAMNMVEPGWTIKLTTSTMQASSYSNQHDRFEMLWADKLGIPASSDKYDRYFKDVPAGIQPVRVGADSHPQRRKLNVTTPCRPSSGPSTSVQDHRTCAEPGSSCASSGSTS